MNDSVREIVLNDIETLGQQIQSQIDIEKEDFGMTVLGSIFLYVRPDKAIIVTAEPEDGDEFVFASASAAAEFIVMNLLGKQN
jgi:hypothetical protein